MSDIVEKAARAIHAFDAGWAGVPAPLMEEAWLREKDTYMARARAGLYAMRDLDPRDLPGNHSDGLFAMQWRRTIHAAINAD